MAVQSSHRLRTAIGAPSAIGMAGVLAAAAALLASAAPAVALGARTGPASTVRAATTARCVGLVVDARALDRGVTTGCEKVGPHATGVAVLAAAGDLVGYRSDGLICTIDKLPTSGCSAVDNTHYWAYFHRAAGSSTWTYSNEGAATYQPAAGTVEGWVYDDGSARQPEDVPASDIFPAATHTTPRPTPRRSTLSPVSSTSTTPHPATSSATTGSGRHHQATAAPSGAPPGSVTATYSPAPSPTPSAPSVTPGTTASSRSRSSSHVLLDVVIVVVALALLGGALLWRRLRP